LAYLEGLWYLIVAWPLAIAQVAGFLGLSLG
jgi:hypothetical protein